MIDPGQIKLGAAVVDSHGAKVGKVDAITNRRLYVKGGRWFRRKYLIIYSWISHLEDDSVVLEVSKEYLEQNARNK